MLTAGEIASLILPLSEEEVKHTVFDMKIDSAPDPDGFSISFYRGCWDTIKGDLMDLINDFYRGNLDIKRLNYSVITLVPKIKGNQQCQAISSYLPFECQFQDFYQVANGQAGSFDG